MQSEEFRQSRPSPWTWWWWRISFHSSRSPLDTIFEHRKKWCLKDMQKQWTQLIKYYNRPYRSLLSNHSSDPCSIVLYFPNLRTFLSLFPSEKCFRVSLFYLSSIKSNLISSPGCSSSFSQGTAAPPSSGIPGSSRLNTMSKHQLFGHPLCNVHLGSLHLYYTIMQVKLFRI